MVSKEYMREWRKNNPDKVKSYRDKLEKKNPNYNKEHYQDNKDSYKDKAQKWSDENPERRREIRKAWNKRNPEKLKKAIQKSYTKHKRRHYLRVIANRKLKNKLIDERGCCEVCNERDSLVIHHKDYAKGNELDNLMLLCTRCHKNIHRRDFTEKYKPSSPTSF